MSRHEELSRFTGSGKTFFFNKGRAKNDTDYLAINALYGQGRRERMVLFPPHYMEFFKHLKSSVEELTGFKFGEDLPEASPTHEKCPNCGWHMSDDEYNRENF